MTVSLHALSHLISTQPSEVVRILIPILQDGELGLKRVGIGKLFYQEQVLTFYSIP